jgi:hypothetical protein
LNVLVANAGVINAEKSVFKEGFEQQGGPTISGISCSFSSSKTLCLHLVTRNVLANTSASQALATFTALSTLTTSTGRRKHTNPGSATVELKQPTSKWQTQSRGVLISSIYTLHQFTLVLPRKFRTCSEFECRENDSYGFQ